MKMCSFTYENKSYGRCPNKNVEVSIFPMVFTDTNASAQIELTVYSA